MDQQAETVFLRLLIPFSFGIIAFYSHGATFYNNEARSTATILCCLCLAGFCTLLLCNLAYSRFKLYKRKGAITIGIYTLAFTIGGWLTLTHQESLEHRHFSKTKGDIYTIRVDDEPQVKNNIIRFKASVKQCFKNQKQTPTSGHLLVAFKLDSLSLLNVNYGDELLIPSKFQELKAPQNPGQFDVKSWLANQNIYHQTFLNSNEVLKTASGKGNPVIAWALALRKRQVDIYQKGIKNPEAFSVASTLILGYRADLSTETLSAYSKTGTIHALSVSGMHVGIIYLVLNFLFGFMERHQTGKVIKLVLVISLIWFYALISGLSPSVLRSVIMLSIYIFAKSFRKDTNSYNIIAFSAFSMLLFNPFLLYDVGFQLSYISVLGLVLLQAKISSWFTFKYKLLDKLWSAVSVSLAAQIATFPLALYYFHQFPVYFLISNLFIMLPVSLIMYLGLVILIFRLYFLMPVFAWLISFTNRGLQFIADLPFSTVSGIWMNKLELMFFIAALSLLIAALTTYRQKLFFPTMICFLAVISSCTYKKWTQHEQRKMIFFSLPKDYASAFIEGNHATLLTNLNSSSPAYKFYVEPALTQLQVINTTFIKYHQNYQTKGLIIKDHQIAFFDQTIFVADTCFNNKIIQTKLKAKLLLLAGNNKIMLPALLQKLQPQIMLIDGTNSNYSAENDASVAKNFKIPSYNLKKLKAYLVNINN
jgi:competence protein ComEC